MSKWLRAGFVGHYELHEEDLRHNAFDIYDIAHN